MTENTAPQNQQNEPSTDTAAQPRRKRTGLAIGAGAVAALVLAGGVAYGVTGNSGGDGGTVGTAAAAESSGNSGASGSDAGTLREVAEQAVSEAGGRGASSIDVEKDGHEVEVELDDGRSADVHVGADGAVRVDPDDEDDDDADASGQDEPVIDLAALQDAVDAGLSSAGEAGVADGVVESVSASDDRGVAYEVSVQGQDGREVDVDLAADFSVVATDIDDDEDDADDD